MSEQTHVETYPITVMLLTRDMKQTARFYCDILGFTMAEASPGKENAAWANFMLDKQSVMAAVPCDATMAKEYGCSDEEAKEMGKQLETFQKNAAGVGLTLYLMVPDVDKYHEQVVKRGGNPHRGPKTQPYGLRDFAIHDPTGYLLHFYTNVPGSGTCG